MTELATSPSVISLRGLVKQYGAVRALNGIDMEVPPGAVGLLGPNGAGKTTLIKLLLGLVKPDGGEASLLGFDPRKPQDCVELRRKVGYMPESDCLPPHMNAVELVGMLARLTGFSANDAMTRAHEALDYVGLDEQRYREIVQYSTGMKQRVKLAQALAHDPPLLLLDEPTNGLDPKGRRHMLDLIADLGHAHGKSLLICSHLLPDIERTCDEVVVLDRGRVAAQGSIAELTRSQSRTARVRVTGDVEGFERELQREGIDFERDGDGRWRVQARGDDADELFEFAGRAGARIEGLEELRSTLDQVFLDVLRRSREAEA
jgi:ABC-2 type transport system ATP-binding protein